VVSGGDIEKSGIDWKCIDNFHLSNGKAIVVNTDTSAGPGIHWIVLVRLGDALYVYDPLGPHNNRVHWAEHNGKEILMPSDPIMESAARRYKISSIVFYPHKTQLDKSDHCGQFAQLVAGIVNQLNKVPAPREVTKLIERFVSTRPGNENVIRKYFDDGK
jgi:hypothetical protein